MKKFLFDTADFEKPQTESAPSFSEEQLRLAQQEARAQGLAEGLAQAHAAQEEQIAQALARLSEQAASLCEGERQREIQQMSEASRMAMKVVHKLMPQFIQKFALGEIERIAATAFEARRDEPRIAITVPSAHLEPLRIRIEDIATKKGFAGQIILLSDDAMSASDCRVEWADGGMERVYERLFSQVENVFAKALSSADTHL